MESALIQLGLSEKEAKFYLTLLEQSNLTASEIARITKETRTNSYMVLDKLVELGVVEVDEETAIRKYRAADPNTLKILVTEKQQAFKQSHSALTASLAKLQSMYSLSQHRPGVLYLLGIDGLRTLLEDEVRTTERVDIIASDEAIENREAWQMLQKGAVKRSVRGIKTRGLFHVSNAKHWEKIKKWENKGYKVRRWGSQPMPGEIAIYGDKIALSVYQPSLVVTILTDRVLASTFRVIFEQLWRSSK